MGLNVANQQLGMGIFGGVASLAASGGIFNTPEKSVKGIIPGFNWGIGLLSGGISALANAGIQYYNARKQIESQTENARLATSAQLVSSDTQFLPTIAMLRQIKYDKKYP